MKNILVITLGTREVQLVKAQIESLTDKFNLVSQDKSTTLISQSKEVSAFNVIWNKDFPDVYTFSPRVAGSIVKEHYPFFRPIIDLPLIRPVLTNLKAKAVQIDLIMLVYTDQQKGFDNQQVKAYNYNNDTLYFADIIQRYIREDAYFDATEFDEFVIEEEVTNVDFQYDFFEKQNKDLFLYTDREIEHVYLLPQGGIDQINQALTLKLIEHFGEKVIQFQNAEGLTGSAVYERSFPAKFLDNLRKHQVMALIEQAEYRAALELRGVNVSSGQVPKGVNKLILLGYYRYNQLWEEAIKLAKNCGKLADSLDWLPNFQAQQTLLGIETDELCLDKHAFILGELLEKVRFLQKIKDTSGMVLAYHVFLETYLNVCLSYYFKMDLTTKFPVYATKIIEVARKESAELNKKYEDSKELSVPFRIDILLNLVNQHTNQVFMRLIQPFIKGKDAPSLSKGIYLNIARNNYAHEGKLVRVEDVPYLDDLINRTSTLFEMNSKNIYITLNKSIKQHL
jgi:hypothetical protein